jgi:large subunit ribosomal protein L22
LAVSKVIASARANAEHNHNYKPNTLLITEISVTPGPRLKRFRPAAHGRALPFERKTSHIRVVVEGEQREAKKPAAKPTAKVNQGKEA